jgi:hypothetical protein
MEEQLISIRSGIVVGISALVLSTQAQAQSVDACLSELNKVQAYMENEPDSDDHPADVGNQFLEMAENAANEGDGKKCMEHVESAKGAVGYSE